MAKLKIKPEHISIVAPHIDAFIAAKSELIADHVKQLKDLHAQGKVKRLETRLVFDLFKGAFIDMAGNNPELRDIERTFYDHVYKYANDTHVESMLRHLIDYKKLLTTGE